MEERPSILAVRSAMDLENHRMQAALVEVLGLEEPALYQPSVRSGELVALRLCDITFAKPWVEVGHLSLSALRDDVKLTRAARVRRRQRENSRCNVEVEDAAWAPGLWPQVAVEVA